MTVPRQATMLLACADANEEPSPCATISGSRIPVRPGGRYETLCHDFTEDGSGLSRVKRALRSGEAVFVQRLIAPRSSFEGYRMTDPVRARLKSLEKLIGGSDFGDFTVHLEFPE